MKARLAATMRAEFLTLCNGDEDEADEMTQHLLGLTEEFAPSDDEGEPECVHACVDVCLRECVLRRSGTRMLWSQCAVFLRHRSQCTCCAAQERAQKT